MRCRGPSHSTHRRCQPEAGVGTLPSSRFLTQMDARLWNTPSRPGCPLFRFSPFSKFQQPSSSVRQLSRSGERMDFNETAEHGMLREAVRKIGLDFGHDYFVEK